MNIVDAAMQKSDNFRFDVLHNYHIGLSKMSDSYHVCECTYGINGGSGVGVIRFTDFSEDTLDNILAYLYMCNIPPINNTFPKLVYTGNEGILDIFVDKFPNVYTTNRILSACDLFFIPDYVTTSPYLSDEELKYTIRNKYYKLSYILQMISEHPDDLYELMKNNLMINPIM